MPKKPDPQIARFIQDTALIDEEKGDLLLSLRNLILQVSPDAPEEIKYGGLVFNKDSQLMCGIFIYKAHVSLEFSYGAMFSDPEKLLEGSGKFRRHLKLRTQTDITHKNAPFYIEQAFMPNG